MSFKNIILSMILLIFPLGLSADAGHKSKPINYYIQHDGEQPNKPEFSRDDVGKDALLNENEQIKDEEKYLSPNEKKKFEKELKKEEKKYQKESAKVKKAKKPSKYKRSKRLKAYSLQYVMRQNKAPVTIAQYLEMSKEVKRTELVVPPPNLKKDDKLVSIPDPGIKIVKYNNPPGGRDVDLRLLMTRRFVLSKAVLSPDRTKSVYSKVYSYPGTQQVASEIFYLNIPEKKSIQSALRDFHTIQEVKTPVIRAGSDYLYENEKRVLSLLDWSEDSKKIAVVEKIGSLTMGPWITQLRTYDFDTKKAYELTALREAIRYYWRTNKGLDLIDYMWDIFPLGWDAVHKDRIIVYAYVYDNNKKSPKFLGTWSIDYKNERPELMSLNGTDFEISINGYAIEFERE